MSYLLDTNVFIQAKNLQYGFDFCPAFWDWIVQEHHAGRVFSIEKIGDELAAQADELSTWAKALGPSFFLPLDSTVAPSLTTLSVWAMSQPYEQAAVSTFLQLADYYLVAHASAHSHVVVTHEVPSSSVRKIKIPNACIGVGVKFMTPYEMLRTERARFVLA